MNERNKKLSNKTILGYSFGALSDAAAYNFYIMYALYYLTSIVGLSAAKGGAILSISTVVTAVISLVIGPISDVTPGRFGRRRPYILFGGIFLLVGMVLFFKPLSMTGGGQFAYYLCTFLILSTAYSVYLVPYNALGAELTDDYNERTKLRTPATIMNCIGNIAGMSLPLGAVAMLMAAGATEGQAWHWFAIFNGVICMVAILITWITTRGKELPPVEKKKDEKTDNIIKVVWQILKLKPTKFIISVDTLFGIVYTVFSSGVTYYVLYCAGLTEAQLSTAMLVYIFIGMAVTVLISMFAQRVSKPVAMGICFLISAAGMTAFYFIGVHSLALLIVLMLAFGVGNCAYWLVIYPIYYDLAELYEYKHGGRKEGTLLSVESFVFAIGTAIGTQVLAWALTVAGYDSSIDILPESTVQGISVIVLLIPVAIYIVAAIVCFFLPLNKKRFELLQKALECKKRGEEADETGLERIL